MPHTTTHAHIHEGREHESKVTQREGMLFLSLLRLGSIYLRLSKYEEAVMVYERALKLRESDFEQYQLHADALKQNFA